MSIKSMLHSSTVIKDKYLEHNRNSKKRRKKSIHLNIPSFLQDILHRAQYCSKQFHLSVYI